MPPPTTEPTSVEYGAAAFLLRRLVRPATYTRALHAARDLPRWREINRRVGDRMLRVSGFTIVQIGANDGLRNDPVHRHMGHLPDALFVEPVPYYYGKLQHTYGSYPGVKFANVAVSGHDGTATMHAVLPEDGSDSRLRGSSSLDRTVIVKSEWVVKDASRIIRPITVPTMRLSTLLDTFEVPRIDYLVVDTEGHDKVVIDQLDGLAPERQPEFILYEHMHLTAPDKTQLETHLQDNGYALTQLRRDTFAQMNGPGI